MLVLCVCVQKLLSNGRPPSHNGIPWWKITQPFLYLLNRRVLLGFCHSVVGRGDLVSKVSKPKSKGTRWEGKAEKNTKNKMFFFLTGLLSFHCGSHNPLKMQKSQPPTRPHSSPYSPPTPSINPWPVHTLLTTLATPAISPLSSLSSPPPPLDFRALTRTYIKTNQPDFRAKSKFCAYGQRRLCLSGH